MMILEGVDDGNGQSLRWKQIPWRDKEKGPVLINCLFSFAACKGIYREIRKGEEGYRKIDDRWDSFVQELFKQPEFMGISGSVRSVRLMFENTIKERARHHGWLDENGGVTGNLSNHEGDLAGLDVNVKQILLYREDIKEAERFSTNLSKELDTNEVTVLTNNLKKKSRRKRKESAEFGVRSSGSSSNVSSEFDEYVLDFFGVNKKKKSSAEIDPASQMKRYFDGFTVENFINESKLNISVLGTLNEITLEVIINLFYHDVCVNGNRDHFKCELCEYGVTKLNAQKICMYLEGIRSSLQSEVHMNSFCTPPTPTPTPIVEL